LSIIKIYGHNEILDRLHGYKENGSLSHAHLIAGENGNGKSLVAKELALLILDKNIDREYIDIIPFRPGKDKNSIGIDDIRVLMEETNKRPFEGDKKVIIIYDGDKMTVQAQNALLKTIEEPPSGIHIIILTKSLEAILETIKSRCQIHMLWKLPFSEMEDFLRAKYRSLEKEKIRQIISFSDGIIGRAIDYIENEDYKLIRENTLAILSGISKNEESITFKFSSFFVKYKDSYREILTWILSFMRDILLYKETRNEDLIINKDKLGIIEELSKKYSVTKINKLTEVITETGSNFISNVNPELSYSNMLYRMQEVFNG
jgi:DNA polymerase III subunit delta'